jgi:hypothetical protein
MDVGKNIQALFGDGETVSKRTKGFINEQKFSIKTGGSARKLSTEQKKVIFLAHSKAPMKFLQIEGVLAANTRSRCKLSKTCFA